MCENTDLSSTKRGTLTIHIDFATVFAQLSLTNKPQYQHSSNPQILAALSVCSVFATLRYAQYSFRRFQNFRRAKSEPKF